jgi:hypothetical protein
LKVHKILYFKKLDYFCAHILRKGTSQWGLDEMGKNAQGINGKP